MFLTRCVFCVCVCLFVHARPLLAWLNAVWPFQREINVRYDCHHSITFTVVVNELNLFSRKHHVKTEKKTLTCLAAAFQTVVQLMLPENNASGIYNFNKKRMSQTDVKLKSRNGQKDEWFLQNKSFDPSGNYLKLLVHWKWFQEPPW